MQSKLKFQSQIQKIEHDLQVYGFIEKMHDLTHTYVFYFDVRKVIGKSIIKSVTKLCVLFFKYLFFRIFCHQHEDRNAHKQKAKLTSIKQRLGETKSKLNLTNKSSYGEDNRENKCRANTTVEIFKQKNKQNKKNRKGKLKQELKTTNCINFSEKEVKSEYEKLTDKLVQVNKDFKQAYFQLIESINNKNRVSHVQIICFLIAIISPDVLLSFTNLLQNNSHTESSKGKEQTNQHFYSLQEQIYIVITFQTLGSLVSPNAFKYLKKKYVKQTIYKAQPSQQHSRLLKSLQFIKDNLRSQKNIRVMMGRKQKQRQKSNGIGLVKFDDQNNFTKEKMKQFIRQALKVKEDFKIDMKTQPKQDLQNQRSFQSIYPIFNIGKSFEKHLIPKESLLNKHSSSIKIKLNIKNSEQRNPSKMIKRKLDLNKLQNTFYKFKSNHEQKQNDSLKQIKSQRPSHKFNRISIEKENKQNKQTKIKKVVFKKQSIQFMKKQIKKFKIEATKDSEIIQQFKPGMPSKQNKLFCNSDDRRHKSPFFRFQDYDMATYHTPLIKNIKQKFNEKNKEVNHRISIYQKQQVWHPMYNIRTQPIPTASTTKSVQAVNRPSYKLSKNSDKLRKLRCNFDQECKRRVEFLEEDIDLVDRMKMK